MKHRTKKPRSLTKGFTIIEVLIVLAIVGLIIMIIFLAVPALKRNSRDVTRKHAAELAASALDEYRNTHDGNYPDTAAEACNFITNYLKSSTGPQGSCTPTFSGSAHCVLVTGSVLDICYHDRNGTPHSYIGPYDEISIMLGHWCNQGSNYYSGDGSNPVTDGGSPLDNEVKRYVVWTQIEGSSQPFCIDNYAK